MSKNSNTGSASFQIEGFTERINSITKHLSTMKKDHSSRRGLLNLVSKRKKLLNYLKRKKPDSYNKVLKQLNLRK